jgi:cyclopropane-fatty-acyl-phospholipid synthase
MPQWLTYKAKSIFLKSLEKVEEGFLEIVCPNRTYSFGDSDASLRARLEIHDERFFVRAVLGGDTGMGESYMAGEWSSPDVVSAVRLAIRNADFLESRQRRLSTVRRALDTLQQRLHKNTIRGSHENIRAHYDLGDDFFRLFLDRSMMYSCAYYHDVDDTLEQAQFEKIDLICRKLNLSAGDDVLEIGTGWGGFALHAAGHYGCHVTTTTISRKQYEHVADRLVHSGPLANRIELLFEDYRNLRGRFDRIVSIEMFEAVGFGHYDDFFSACDRLLKPEGSMLLQTITLIDQKFEAYRRKADWLQKYIFPGAQLGSLSGILDSIARSTQLTLYHTEDLGIHYARTLEQWRARFRAHIADVRLLGFDECFIRMWDFYLGSCAGSFLERYISDVQLIFSKTFNRSRLMNEPWPASLNPTAAPPSDFDAAEWVGEATRGSEA